MSLERKPRQFRSIRRNSIIAPRIGQGDRSGPSSHPARSPAEIAAPIQSPTPQESHSEPGRAKGIEGIPEPLHRHHPECLATKENESLNVTHTLPVRGSRSRLGVIAASWTVPCRSHPRPLGNSGRPALASIGFVRLDSVRRWVRIGFVLGAKQRFWRCHGGFLGLFRRIFILRRPVGSRSEVGKAGSMAGRLFVHCSIIT